LAGEGLESRRGGAAPRLVRWRFAGSRRRVRLRLLLLLEHAGVATAGAVVAAHEDTRQAVDAEQVSQLVVQLVADEGGGRADNDAEWEDDQGQRYGRLGRLIERSRTDPRQGGVDDRREHLDSTDQRVAGQFLDLVSLRVADGEEGAQGDRHRDQAVQDIAGETGDNQDDDMDGDDHAQALRQELGAIRRADQELRGATAHREQAHGGSVDVGGLAHYKFGQPPESTTTLTVIESVTRRQKAATTRTQFRRRTFFGPCACGQTAGKSGHQSSDTES
ncbi:hypothetical protein PBRA_009433, partial [Plasmodiophora brassicae]